MATCRVQRYGPAALLITLPLPLSDDSPAALDKLAKSIEALPLPGVREMVRGYVTLLIEFFSPEFCSEESFYRVEHCASALSWNGLPHAEGEIVEVPICYDGPDLGRVAAHTGLSEKEIIERHTARLYTVHFLGFSPGFPYLSGMDPSLATPRLASPRPRVLPGSVGIGGSQTGIYSVATPGGWNLIGRTSLGLFDPSAATEERMFRFRAGQSVRFVEAEVLPPTSSQPRCREISPPATPVFKVIRHGAGMSLQDHGRSGWKRFGVPPSGGLDRFAMDTANRLAGNEDGQAVIELCLGGQQLEVLRTTHLAIAGADLGCTIERPDGGGSFQIPAWEFAEIQVGSRIQFRRQISGVWAYLAIPGGFCGYQDLGSISGNSRANLGHLYLEGGEIMARLKVEPGWTQPVGHRRLCGRARPNTSAETALRVWPGPQWDWFSPEQRERFFSQGWGVCTRSDRAGYRLEGQGLEGGRPELLSEPALPGSIQILPNGQPVVTLHDGPTVSGYPRLGLVHEDDLRLLIQTRAGSQVKFRAHSSSPAPI